MNRPRSLKEHGYALPEVLIATAIAAAVLAVVASAASGLVRLEAAANDSADRLQEAQVIAARLRAGISSRDALEGFDGWSIERDAFQDNAFQGNNPVFDIVRIAYGDGKHAIEILAHEDASP